VEQSSKKKIFSLKFFFCYKYDKKFFLNKMLPASSLLWAFNAITLVKASSLLWAFNAITLVKAASLDLYPVPLEEPCDHLPWPKQLFCFLSHARTTPPPAIPGGTMDTTGSSETGTNTVQLGADAVKQMVVKDGLFMEPTSVLKNATASEPKIRAMFTMQEQTYKTHKRHRREAEEESIDLKSHRRLPRQLFDKLPTLFASEADRADADGNNTVCFSCMASAVGEDSPNENCSRDIMSIEEAVKMNIRMISCPTVCYTNVLRIGAYVTSFRGCYHPEENRRMDTAWEFGQYNCSRLVIMGAEWWDCHCRGHFCNNKMPSV